MYISPGLMFSPEASRAKHKFAVKRNSWPKTRGVAMNPVDHVSNIPIVLTYAWKLISYSLTVVVITNILEKPQQFHVMHPRVKRLVSSLPGELVYCAVLKLQGR
jgi:hypothetical protein